MSTLFGIKTNGKIVKVLLRHNGGKLEVLNDLLFAISNKRKVYPLDNTAQGINTVKDIKMIIFAKDKTQQRLNDYK